MDILGSQEQSLESSAVEKVPIIMLKKKKALSSFMDDPCTCKKNSDMDDIQPQSFVTGCSFSTHSHSLLLRHWWRAIDMPEPVCDARRAQHHS